jgi:hypothetical protein
VIGFEHGMLHEQNVSWLWTWHLTRTDCGLTQHVANKESNSPEVICDKPVAAEAEAVVVEVEGDVEGEAEVAEGEGEAVVVEVEGDVEGEAEVAEGEGDVEGEAEPAKEQEQEVRTDPKSSSSSSSDSDSSNTSSSSSIVTNSKAQKCE